MVVDIVFPNEPLSLISGASSAKGLPLLTSESTLKKFGPSLISV